MEKLKKVNTLNITIILNYAVKAALNEANDKITCFRGVRVSDIV